MSDEKNDLIGKITTPAETVKTPPPAPVTPKAAEVSEDDLLSGKSQPITPTPKAAEVSEDDLLSGTSQPTTATPNNPTDQPPTSGEPEKKRGRGRPPGSTNKPKAADFSDIASAVDQAVNYRQMSEALFDMSTGLLSTTFGPEWQPRPVQKVGEIVIDERGAVVSALEVYLRSKKAQDIPPGLMLTFVVVAYAGPRFAVPTTKDKIKPLALFCWNKIKSFFSRKPKFNIVPASQN